MGRPTIRVFAGIVAAGLSTSAFAADFPAEPYPEAIHRAPIEIGGGWYLRGDLGFSNQEVKRLDNVLIDPSVFTNLDIGFDAAPFAGVGVGYKFNHWVRGDITGEYRAKANFHALDRYSDPFQPTGFGANDYGGSKSEWVYLANLYFDLGTWASITPFVGVGIGAAHNTIHHYRDVNVPTQGVAYANKDSNFDLAWAVHAGLSYQVTPTFTVELGYRYLNLGDAKTGDVITYDGVSTINNPTTFKELTSHDVKFGMRWALGGPVYGEQPVTRKY